MNITNIGSRREVCWDEELIEKADGIGIKMHKPQYRGDALVCDKPWEGNICCYFTLVHDDGKLRLYYRGRNFDVNADGTGSDKVTTATMCQAVSDDGITFSRINAGIVPRDGHTDNNILTDKVKDNMFFFKDSNPDCPPQSQYKALAEHNGSNLWLFESADGVHFEEKRMLVNDGAYDSLNTCFWDAETKQYYLFYRGVHGEGTLEGKWASHGAKHTTVVRDIRMRTSPDFIHWSEPKMLQYGAEAEDYELYTNCIQKYYRAPHMFLGFPTRYADRHSETSSFLHLPDYEHRQRYIRLKGRIGTAMTDTCIMTSRDGVNFRRTDKAFMTPGPERGNNWYYGDGYLCYGMVETPSPIAGEPEELSLYMPVNYRADNVVLRRYGIRIDGFFSWSADYVVGKVVTKPLTFTGDSLFMNFATSALGFVCIRILDEKGNPIDGYDSGNHFGDSLDRPVAFAQSLARLNGMPVRLEFTMKDAELYSFQFV